MELPDLERSIHLHYSADDVRVVGVHESGDPIPLVQDFIEQTGITFEVVPDQDRTLWDFTYPPGVNFPYPRDVVIDQNLIVRSIKNSFDPDEMRTLIDGLLAEE